MITINPVSRIFNSLRQNGTPCGLFIFGSAKVTALSISFSPVKTLPPVHP